MTDASKSIWDDYRGPPCFPDSSPIPKDHYSHPSNDALVAAAYEDAQKRPTQRCAECDCNGGGENCNWIKPVSRTPDKAQAAYDAAISQARREGWEAAKKESVATVSKYLMVRTPLDVERVLDAEKAIQDLEYKEPE